MRWMFRDPRTQPLAPARLDAADAASIHIWKHAQMATADPPTVLNIAGLALFSAAPVEAFIPAVEADLQYAPDVGRSYIYAVLPHIFAKPQPTTAETRAPRAPKVSPNAPCPCGSGKKAKKCCHAA